MKVAIVGAGIGGLAAAILIARVGHPVAVFEQFAEPAPVGSGLMIQPVGLEVLRRCGAAEAAQGHARLMRRILGRSAATGRRVLDVAYGAEPGLGIHRAALFGTLYDVAQDAGLDWHTGRRVSARDGGRLVLDDGNRSDSFDLIVDASGVNSVLSPLKGRDLPFGAIWATVDWVPGALPEDHLSQRYLRADRMVGVLPVGRLPGGETQKAALFWSLKRDGHDAWLRKGLDAWAAEVMELWPEAEPFVRQIRDPGQMTMARYSHGSLRRPFGPGLVHIGDAAHRASPQLGQGANMALLDAAALAEALETARPEEVPAAYARARRWHVGVYQAISAAFTPAYQSDSRWLPVLRDRVLFPLSLIPPAPWMLSRLVSGTLLPTGLRR